VGQRKISEANFKFSQGDAIAKVSTTRKSLILPGAATVLRGTVLDNQNHPVAGAKVSTAQSESAISVFTGSNGTFELRNLKPGAYRITVYKVGYSGVGQTFALRSGGIEQRNFQLEKETSPLIAGLLKNQAARRGEIRGPSRRDDQNLSKGGVTGPAALKRQLMGRVTDATTGKPLSGVSISTRGRILADTDAKGNYTVSGLPPGNYPVSVERSGYILESRSITIHSGPATRQDFVLKAERRSEGQAITGEIRKSVTIGAAIRTGQVTGQVIDAASGKPIPGATVSLVGQRGVVTDLSGRFSISNLGPGNYQITVGKAGFATDQRAVVVRAGETAPANFKLKPLTRQPMRLRLP
jgi:protocatechuate 3,4-dioxygenase beta subunit